MAKWISCESMPSTFNVAGTFQVPSAIDSLVFEDGTRSVPATIGPKVDGIGRERSGLAEVRVTGCLAPFR